MTDQPQCTSTIDGVRCLRRKHLAGTHVTNPESIALYEKFNENFLPGPRPIKPAIHSQRAMSIKSHARFIEEQLAQQVGGVPYPRAAGMARFIEFGIHNVPWDTFKRITAPLLVRVGTIDVTRRYGVKQYRDVELEVNVTYYCDELPDEVKLLPAETPFEN